MTKYYCGYQTLPKWFRKILSYKFNASCRLHDMHYRSNTKRSQLDADIEFLRNCLKQANANMFWSFMAYAAYFIVRLLGKKAYKGDMYY